ncbi:MAG: branched-chain amino acid ABC transporter permease [Candidatus Promineifilaceae bacterium]
MAQATDQVSAPRVAEARESAQAGGRTRQADLGRAARLGALGGLTVMFVAAVGMLVAFNDRVLIQPAVTLSYVILFAIPFVFGYLAGQPPAEVEGLPPVRTGPRNVLAGLIVGLIVAAISVLFVLLTARFDLGDIFLNLLPQMRRVMTLDQESRSLGLTWLAMGHLVLATLAAAAAIAPPKWRQPLLAAVSWTVAVGLLEAIFQQVLRGLEDVTGIAAVESVRAFLFSPRGGLEPVGAAIIFVLVLAAYVALGRRQGRPLAARFEELDDRQRRRTLTIGAIGLAVVLYFLPRIGGVFVSEVLDLVGIYLLMGLGLNIVVGYAGLLDLGYVAFFAVGAYATAILTSPSSPAWSPELTFWAAIPFVVLAAALAGILVGTPVLRLRGDYLAIVTLGFGEIARILFVSEWLVPYVGGAQGILSIPKIRVGTFVAATPPDLFYPILGFVLVTIYIAWALKRSRIGRAWMAMREDEPVAEAMGIDITAAKLSAFVVGAVLASFGGALFATKIGSIFPHSFEILVSITVLVLIIVGGMGSIPGVIVGALILVGLPNLLREFDEYRLLFYGALLIFMMLKKPEGFIPEKERMRELHQDEAMQDAWVKDHTADRERAQPTLLGERDQAQG